MNEQRIQVIQLCAEAVSDGNLTFPEIVGQLAQIGVERYHAGYFVQLRKSSHWPMNFDAGQDGQCRADPA